MCKIRRKFFRSNTQTIVAFFNARGSLFLYVLERNLDFAIDEYPYQLIMRFSLRKLRFETGSRNLTIEPSSPWHS